jgi:hypothetical protein
MFVNSGGSGEGSEKIERKYCGGGRGSEYRSANCGENSEAKLLIRVACGRQRLMSGGNVWREMKACAKPVPRLLSCW